MSKLVPIVGAAAGPGRAVTARLDGQGWRLALVGRDAARLFAGPLAEQGAATHYPLARHGSVEDAAGAVAWLRSDEAQWVSGQVLPVDGGFTALRPAVRAGAPGR
jgi:NAD(P)-dependent dehydrogenase (short-subunit alcohol dehydrogenase family)